MANPNGSSAPALNGTANSRNVRAVMGAPNPQGGSAQPKVDPNDPQVRKLVYNMYRGMLDQKHQRANVIVDNAPQDKVETDAGVGARVQSMMRQQNELKRGGMNTAGAPPPPPPPPIPGVLPSSRLPSEIPARVPVMNPPAALAGAMMKEKKPFTYTPGGIDLSEINSQQQNGNEVDAAPVQSRSFRVLQSVLSNQEPADAPSNGMPIKVEVPLGSASPSTQPRGAHHTASSHVNGGNRGSQQRGSFSQPSSVQRGPVSLANMGQRGSVSNCGNPISKLKVGPEQQIRVIPIQQETGGSPKIGGFKANNSNGNELSSIFRNQVQVSTDNDEARSRGGYFPTKTVVVMQNCEPQGPVHIPNIRQQQKSSPVQHSHQPSQYQPPSPYQPPGGVTNPAHSEATPDPKKYMGGSIPSRSFKMLQAMTADDAAVKAAHIILLTMKI